jgi:hypothetical protein
MTDKDKIEILKNCFHDVIWMAIRYAHGRHTYSPSMVRDAIYDFKKVFPEYELKHDRTIEAPKPECLNGIAFESDYLHDLFKKDIEEF